jgi:hypothetical protein
LLSDAEKDIVKVFFNEVHTLSEQFVGKLLVESSNIKIGELYLPLNEIKSGETVTIETATKNHHKV